MESLEEGIVVTNGAESSLVPEVKEKQDQDPILFDLNASVHSKRVLAFKQGGDAVLKYQGKLYVPKVDGVQERILEEARSSRCFIHMGSKKNQVKVEHQRPGGLAQNTDILEWKWEMINMNFITGLPRSRRQHDSIWVIVDKISKSANFSLVKTTYSTKDYAKVYLHESARLHGVPISIISGRGSQLTEQFLKSIHKGLGSKNVQKSGQCGLRVGATPRFKRVHPVFHISMLKKCLGDPSLRVPIENVGIKDNFSYEEVPVQILDR
ncbi:uncharacterized protein [Solanum lycopersicum]|uniref:uncharacterized protein n=1 Tax=Solanum lycopersicum TaxID=4081 RepID=UPI0037489849